MVRENSFIGGIAERNGVYRIKHVATGLLLSIKKTGKLFLTSETESDYSLFKINQEPSDIVYQTFNSLVKIESNSLNRLVMASASENIESVFESNEKFSSIDVSTTMNRKLDTQTTFVLIDEPESTSIYIYQISSLIPKMVEFFNFIKTWGCLKKGTTLVQNYQVAKATEGELESQVAFFLRILTKIRKRVLVDGLKLKERQDTLRLTGFLDILIRFEILLDKKLDLPAKFPVEQLPKLIRKSKVKMIQEGQKVLKEEFLQFPAVVGLKHLTKLSIDIYETIYQSVKDNVNSCNFLQKHQEFLSFQLHTFKDQIGILIKELYKQSSEVIASSNTEQLKL